MELISREDLVNALVDKGQASKRYKVGETWELNGTELREVIDSLPTIESRPKGKWDTVSREKEACEIFFFNKKCSNCGYEYCFPFNYNYCPNCGADMRGEEQ